MLFVVLALFVGLPVFAQDLLHSQPPQDRRAPQKETHKEEAVQHVKDASLSKMLNGHWNADAVAFEGTITCTKDGANAWRTYFDINPAFFTGKAMLALDCYGVAVFVFAPEPSQKAYNEGRVRALQIHSFCEKLASVVEKGKYRIEGRTLFIDDKDFGTFSADWKTFTHEEQGMLKTVMKITGREKISADGQSHILKSK